MKTIRHLFSAVLAGLVLQQAATASMFEVESTYVGDGWFSYRVKTIGDPRFTVVTLKTLNLPVFLNRVQYGTNSPSWTPSADPIGATWNYVSSGSQPAGYEARFTVRSSERTFRTATVTALGYDFEYVDSSTTQVASGSAEFSVLVPCLPAQADNSPTNRVSGFDPLPPLADLKIDKLVARGGAIEGIGFSYSGDFTVTLQATTNFVQWSDVARLRGVGVSNVWTTNQPLNSYGNFFRLQLNP
jgi:hypothetical protein